MFILHADVVFARSLTRRPSGWAVAEFWAGGKIPVHRRSNAVAVGCAA